MILSVGSVSMLSVSSSLLRGLTGWKHALFGKSDDENEDEKDYPHTVVSLEA